MKTLSDAKASHMHVRAANCLVIVCAVIASTTDARSTVNEIDHTQQLKTYMQAAAESLEAEQAATLTNIKDEDRRHLAMTYYLRAGHSIASRWSWTNERIKTYEQSTEYAEALTEIAIIAKRFSAENPQTRLYANTKIRSLEEQLKRWQSVNSIGEAASELREAALATLAHESYGRTPNTISIKRFRYFLSTWRASRSPSLTAPGLSLHGRGRAYDFQVRDKKGRTIADTDTSTIATIWEDQGWAEKLSSAVHGASNKFIGPLLKPNEPWHYEYRPDN